MYNLFSSYDISEVPDIVGWQPAPEQVMYGYTDKYFIAPISKFFGFNNNEYPHLDAFSLYAKQAYYNQSNKEQLCQVLNYYNAYFDKENTLLAAYAQIKYNIDYQGVNYLPEAFKKDILTLILTPSRMIQIDLINKRNYRLNLNFDNDKKVLAYNDDHARLLMKSSILIKMCIPIVSHYAMKSYPHMNKLDFITECFHLIFDTYNINILSKIYETSSYIVKKSVKTNPIWDRSTQSIRGVDQGLHVSKSLEQVIYNLMPKYDYDKNVVTFNHTSLERMVKYEVTGLKYEFEFRAHMPNVGNSDDEDVDRFEDTLAKQDQSALLLTKYNYRWVMDQLEQKYGPLDQNEIDFYIKELSDENGQFTLKPIQKELIGLHFYKYFVDPNGMIGNRDDYVKLIIILKKILPANNMVLLPYILTGKIEKAFNKTSLKKSEREKLRTAEQYIQLQNKYKGSKALNNIEALIAVVLTMKVYCIDYNDPKIHGQKIPIKPDIIVEELLRYILMI